MKPRFSIRPATEPAKSGNVRPIRIVHIDDEPWFGELMEEIIKDTIHGAVMIKFQNSDEAWTELQKADPDLLITDMNNTNIPGRNIDMGMDGWKLLPLLVERKVKYPVLVVSGSFSIFGMEAKARKCAGPDLNVSFMTKPFPIEFFQDEIMRMLLWKRRAGRRF